MAVGDKETLLRVVPEAAADFHDMFQHELRAQISESKAITVASSPSLAAALAVQLRRRGLPAGTVTNASLNLGVDFAPGQARDAPRALRKRRERFRAFKLRHSRVLRFRR